MSLQFNVLLTQNGIDLRSTRLLRHQDRRLGRRSPYRAWFDDRAAFEAYQAVQVADRRSYFRGRHWASFIATPDGRTMFVGIYETKWAGLIENEIDDPLGGHALPAGRFDRYNCVLLPILSEYQGRLFVHWGEGSANRAWVQKANSATGDKQIVELTRTIEEAAFPGYAAFQCSLSEIDALPATWRSALSAARGIYLLTCPRTREQYVGAAYSDGGFLSRWQQYARDGHGGNIRLKSRDPSDYRVSILELASFATSEAEIVTAESRWKAKLQSREMGLNAN